MLSHERILDTLWGSFGDRYGESGVTTVARYMDPGLRLPERRVQIFLPDFHLLSQRDAPAYPNWGFVQGEDLLLLMKALTKLKADSPGQLRVWHLGDLFDIWRARGGMGDAAELNEIEADHAEVIDILRDGPPYGVRAEIMAGNHDFATFKLSEWRAARFRIIESSDPNGGDILVVHGDLFSWLERFVPEEIKSFAVKIATKHAAGEKDLFDQESIGRANRDLKPGDNPLGTAQAELAHAEDDLDGDDEFINVIDGDRGDKKADNKRFFAAAKDLAEALRARGYDIRVVVVGHTHFARIVTGNDDRAEPFVLLDAGAWIGRCRLTPDQENPIHNAQIGVLAGNDLRIYQLGWRPVV